VTVRLLLDTHALLWWLDGDRRLSLKARRAIASQSNSLFVSAVSAWEITTKARLGKLPGATDVAADVAACVASQGFLSLDVTILHAQRAGRLPGVHRDPFDRMLIAQSQIEDIALVSDDEAFDKFEVQRFW
jgi:PIN domain nuclease of toxin-antitoxin system